jgi:NAD-dependent DNA ligase
MTRASDAIPKKCILAALAPPRSYPLRTKKVILKCRAPARCQQHHVTQIKYFTGTLEIESLHNFESQTEKFIESTTNKYTGTLPA